MFREADFRLCGIGPQAPALRSVGWFVNERFIRAFESTPLPVVWAQRSEVNLAALGGRLSAPFVFLGPPRGHEFRLSPKGDFQRNLFRGGPGAFSPRGGLFGRVDRPWGLQNSCRGAFAFGFGKFGPPSRGLLPNYGAFQQISGRIEGPPTPKLTWGGATRAFGILRPRGEQKSRFLFAAAGFCSSGPRARAQVGFGRGAIRGLDFLFFRAEGNGAFTIGGARELFEKKLALGPLRIFQQGRYPLVEGSSSTASPRGISSRLSVVPPENYRAGKADCLRHERGAKLRGTAEENNCCVRAAISAGAGCGRRTRVVP